MYEFENTYVKWKERESEDPYDIFDKTVHDRLRNIILPPLKVYVKSQEIDSDIPGKKPMITIIHIYEKKAGGLSFYYQVNNTDGYLMQQNGSTNVATECVKSFKKYILGKYLASNAGVSQ